MIKKLLNELIKFPVRLYQWVISPLKPSTCRHEPTCSNYMLQAVDEWGPLKGFWLGLKRISKCHPWGTHGYDPVPKRKQQKIKKDSSSA